MQQNILGGTTNIASTILAMPNGGKIDAGSGPTYLDLQPGTYFFKVVLQYINFGSQVICADTGVLTWQIFHL